VFTRTGAKTTSPTWASTNQHTRGFNENQKGGSAFVFHIELEARKKRLRSILSTKGSKTKSIEQPLKEGGGRKIGHESFAFSLLSKKVGNPKGGNQRKPAAIVLVGGRQLVEGVVSAGRGGGGNGRWCVLRGEAICFGNKMAREGGRKKKKRSVSNVRSQKERD